MSFMRIILSWEKFKSLNRLICILIILSVLQFFILTFIAAYLYPGGYDYFGYYFSDLGAVAARNGETNLISRILFSVALTLLALALIPFWLTLGIFLAENKKKKILSTTASTLGVISTPFLIGLALLPMDTQLELHLLATLIFVLLFILAVLLCSIIYILNKNYPKYIGFIGLVLFIIPIASFTASITNPTATLGAFLQKIALYGYFIWVLLPINHIWNSIKK